MNNRAKIIANLRRALDAIEADEDLSALSAVATPSTAIVNVAWDCFEAIFRGLPVDRTEATYGTAWRGQADGVQYRCTVYDAPAVASNTHTVTLPGRAA